MLKPSGAFPSQLDRHQGPWPQHPCPAGYGPAPLTGPASRLASAAHRAPAMLAFLFLTQAQLLPTTGPLHSLCALPEGAAPRALPGRSAQHSAPSDARPAPPPLFTWPRRYLKSPRSPVVPLSPLVSSLPRSTTQRNRRRPGHALPRAQNGRHSDTQPLRLEVWSATRQDAGWGCV